MMTYVHGMLGHDSAYLMPDIKLWRLCSGE